MQKVLAAASVYNEKFYVEPDFNAIPKTVLEEVKNLCIKSAQEISCIFSIGFKDNGAVYFETQASDMDNRFDEATAQEKVEKILIEKADLIQRLSLWYRVFVLKEIPDEFRD